MRRSAFFAQIELRISAASTVLVVDVVMSMRRMTPEVLVVQRGRY